MTERLIADYVAGDELIHFVACGVEGCPRVVEKGWEQACGLWKLGLPQDPELCAAVIFVDQHLSHCGRTEEGRTDG